MKDFDRLIVRFKQFGGLRLVWEYAKLGVLWEIVKEFFRCLVRRESFKRIYPAILKRIEPKLLRYVQDGSSADAVQNSSRSLDSDNVEQVQTSLNHIERAESTRIWWCWLQGVENAPALAKCCLKSLEKLGTEIVIVDDKNYTEWVELPEYIVSKYNAGRIPSALFSDILRLALLITHGGVWVDSTVLCTHTDSDSTDKKYCPSWKTICEAELFLFQYTRPGEKWNGSTGNWFIAAKPNNPMLIRICDALCKYWKENNVTLDYYIFHLFFSELSKEYSEIIKQMPYGYATACLQLRNSLGEQFTEEKWEKICSLSNFHKMGFRLKGSVKEDKGNYYNHIINNYKETYTKII